MNCALNSCYSRGRAGDDPRVVHYWDDQKKVGRFFAGKDPESSDPDVVWDAYYRYAPKAQWLSQPEPLVSKGITVPGRVRLVESRLSALTEVMRSSMWVTGLTQARKPEHSGRARVEAHND